MDLAINLIFFIIVSAFMVLYIVSFIINLIRAIKVNKSMQVKSVKVKGIVSQVVEEKRRVYVKVDYKSLINGENFYNVFEFTKSEWTDQYKEGDEVDIIYPDTTDVEKVICFPVYLEGMKVKVESGPVFTDALVAFSGLFIFALVLITYITKNGFSDMTSLCNFNIASCMEPTKDYEMFTLMYVIMILFIYIMLAGYLKERFTSLSSTQNQNYLKLVGQKCTAEVLTFKFGRTKNQQGLKEAQLKIQFFTSKGEKINCDLNSFMYSETQEQFINILYDPKKPVNCVYLKKPVK